jgi:elongation factor 3
MTEILPNNLSFCNADCFNPVDYDKLKNNKELIYNYIETIIIDNNFINTNILNLLLINLDTAEIALLIIEKLSKKYPKYESYLIDFIPSILNYASDKKYTNLQIQLHITAKEIINIVSIYATDKIQKYLFDGISSNNWQTKILALELLGQFSDKSVIPFSKTLSNVMPIVSNTIWDTKKEVKEISKKTLLKSMNTCQNNDIKDLIPVILDTIENPEKVPETLHKLSSTVFVQSVDNSTLSIIVPILLRGCQEKKIESKRRVCVIADNMCKLIDYPHDAATFLPELKPKIIRLSEEMSDPEARLMAKKCLKTLDNIEDSVKSFEDTKKLSEKETKSIILKYVDQNNEDNLYKLNIDYLSSILSSMINSMLFDKNEWDIVISHYLAPDNNLLTNIYNECYKTCIPKDSQEDENDEGEDLCNCEFSLGYGAKILLNNTRLHLKRGKRYGICGYNGCGKSTLLKAIANGQVDNFPPPDVLKTVYVEHDIQGSYSDYNLIDFVKLANKDIENEIIHNKLLDFGFSEDIKSIAYINSTISNLSGGWKMKIALCSAILQDPDILLLDEPTNHLDVKNVEWLEKFLISQDRKTSLIISHDTGFLDRVTTHIIHYEDNRKLKNYKGNLESFVKRVPKAKTYYELSDDNLSFIFPTPGLLDGIKSKGKAIIKMEKCTYKYPTKNEPTVFNITLQASLNSRVAVIGPNGAGKSTIIKMFCGEIKPSIGNVWRHQNMRIAYIAQHAFHHLEKHLDKTPNEYIQWRYSSGEDREKIEEDNKEDLTKEKVFKNDDGTINKGVIEYLCSRRKTKRSYEYEVKWLNKDSDKNTWLSREKLEENGYAKLVQRLDQQEALRSGLATKSLTTKSIEKQLNEIGIDSEFATHSRIRGLSGGQKVKVALAACMWNNPHILVMDEPTNYLDRDSLGALASAIKKFEGGVVLISHNKDFTDNICTEKWVVENGYLTKEGEEKSDEKINLNNQTISDVVLDSLGNEIKVKKEKVLTAREKKKLEKKRKERRDKGLPTDSDEDF